MILTPPPTPTEGINMLSFSFSDKSESLIKAETNKEGYHNDDNNSCAYNNCSPSPLLCSDVTAALLTKDDRSATGGENGRTYFRFSTCERYFTFIKDIILSS